MNSPRAARSSHLFLGNKNIWKPAAWPTLFALTLFFLFFPHWVEAAENWRNLPPEWGDETVWPVELRLEGRQGDELCFQAAKLENHPVLIYEFVRNKIEYEAAPGSRFGALGTLDRRRGSAADKALLLAGLLRAAYLNLRREQPQLWLVKGDVRLSGPLTLDWLGVPDGESVQRALQSAGVKHQIQGSLAAGGAFDVILRDHIWLRADIAYGPMRGTRMIEGHGRARVDLDPSIVALERVEQSPTPQSLGIDQETFYTQVFAFSSRDENAGSASNLPEAFMLQQVDSAASVLRRLLEERRLTVREALFGWRPTIQTVDALPESLPYELESAPQAFDLFDGLQREDILNQLRHRVGVRVTQQPTGAHLASGLFSTAELYEKTLTVAFEASEAVSPEEQDAPAQLAGWGKPVLARALVNGAVASAGSGLAVPYGTPARLEIAYRGGNFEGNSAAALFGDPLAKVDRFDTRAGGVFVVAPLPSLNSKTIGCYRSEATTLAMRTSGAGNLGDEPDAHVTNPAQALGPVLDLAAQAIAARTEEFFELGALATGHRAAPWGEWALAGLEPVFAQDATSGPLYAEPRFVFASRRAPAALALASVGSGSSSESAGLGFEVGGNIRLPDDPRRADTASVQTILQLMREALLRHGPELALRSAADPITPGHVIRDGNAAGFSTFLVDASNQGLLATPASASERVPSFNLLANNLRAQAASGGQLLLASPQTLAEPEPPAEGEEEAEPNSLGEGWGYFVWNSAITPLDYRAYTPAGEALRAFSGQKLEANYRLTPADLIASGQKMHYQRLAEFSIRGVDALDGSLASTGRACAASMHNLASLLERSANGTPAQRAAARGSAVVLLHAELEEFSRPEVLSLELLLTPSADNILYPEPPAEPIVLAPGEPFNPAYYDKIVARGAFNQSMEVYQFRAFDGLNNDRGRFPLAAETLPDVLRDLREVEWTLKDITGGTPEEPTEETNLFAFVESFNADGSDYSGPYEIRLEGQVEEGGARSRPESIEFVIDTEAPRADVIDWDANREYRGEIVVRGTATDLHFRDYAVSLAQGSGLFDRELAYSTQPAPGAATLARWQAGDENANGLYQVRLLATDRAGNSAENIAPLSVRNDNQAPFITFPEPEFVPVSDTNNGAPLKVAASDNGANDSGLKRFQVWMDYETGNYAPAPAPAAYIIAPKTETLLDETFSAPFPPLSEVFETVNTGALQARPGGAITLRARAEDAFGNVREASRAIPLNNGLFNVRLSPSIISPEPDPQTGAIRNARLEVHQSDTSLPLVEVYAANNLMMPVAGPLTPFYSGLISSAGVFLAVYDISPAMLNYEAGRYKVRTTRGAQVVERDLFLLPPGQPVADIATPLNTILLKNEINDPDGSGPEGGPLPAASAPGLIPIYGRALSESLNFNDGRLDSEPIERLLPASRPYWLLSYKRRSDPPDFQTQGVSFVANNVFIHEGNWRKIAHGFSQKLPTINTDTDAENDVTLLGNWDISRLPAGQYDLRLVVTDGYLYATTAVMGYKVINSAVLPGENADDREPGALQLRQVDMALNFEGFPIEIARSYNSLRAQEEGDFGFGWKLEGLNLKVVQTVSENQDFGERIEAEITLPDGRTLTYANRPPNVVGELSLGTNAWIRQGAFRDRPYGQMLWMPGRAFKSPYADQAVLFGGDHNNTLGGIKIREALRDRTNAHLPSGVPPTTIEDFDLANPLAPYFAQLACLQLEDGSFLIFDWRTGELARRDYGDGIRKVNFDPLEVTPQGQTILSKVSDHLGRSITVHRDSESRIDWVQDPRGFKVHYAYNAAGELAEIEDRAGNKRWLFYDDPDFPHFLTSMVVDRQAVNQPGHGVAGEGDTTIAYEYNNDARLEGIDTGAGVIGMEYEDTPAGGVQTVVDEATGGRSEVHYDLAGRVTKQVDPAGVETLYEYHEEGGNFNVAPPGALRSQTVQGVKTEFEYDLEPYQPEFFGYEGMAQQFTSFWLTQGSDGQLQSDFPGVTSGPMFPGYLTSQQVQPSSIKTPAVGPDGIDHGDRNEVRIEYDPAAVGAPATTRLDGTGKIYGVTDPEGRQIGLSYGEPLSPERNETTRIAAPAGTSVTNAYFDEMSLFAGRLQTSQTLRDLDGPDGEPAEVLSTTTYAYAQGTPSSFAELGIAMEQAVTDAGGSINAYWPGFATAWIERQSVTTTGRDGEEPTTSTTYLDALGNSIASFDANGDWSATLFDAEGRSVLTASSGGGWSKSFYDGAGLLVRSESASAADPDTGERELSISEFDYDAQGRQIATRRDGELVSSTLYETLEDGSRRVVNIDADGNRSLQVKDSAGRLSAEIFEGASGSRRVTSFEYDEHGRQYRTISPRGLISETLYDEGGREIESRSIAEGRAISVQSRFDEKNHAVWRQSTRGAQANPPIYTTYLYRIDTQGITPTLLDDVTSIDHPTYGALVAIYTEDPSPATPGYGPSESGYFEQYEYDEEGRQTAVVKPIQLKQGAPVTLVKTSTEYNEDGRVQRVVFNDVEVVTDPSRQDVEFFFFYDENGNRSKVRYPSGIEKEWQRAYDAEGALQSLAETQPGGNVWKTSIYTEEGFQESRIVDATGNIIDFGYNDFRLASKTYTLAGATEAVYNHRFIRGDFSQEVRTYAGAGEGNLLRTEREEFSPENFALTRAVKPEGTISYGYDDSGALTETSYLGRSIHYEYDFYGRLSRALAPEATWIYSYDDNGLKKRVENLTASIVENYERDDRGQLTALRHININTGEVLFGIEYHLSIDGMRLGATEQRGNDFVEWEYEYDELNRLTQERRDEGADGSFERDISYSYDPDSNRIAVINHNDATKNEIYLYEPNSQRLSRVERADGKLTQFTWTANGEMASEIVNGAVEKVYEWGPDGTLQAVQLPTENMRVEYNYDYEGILVARRVFAVGTSEPTEATNYLVDDRSPAGFAQVVAEINAANGTVSRVYAYADRLRAQTDLASQENTPRFTLTDGLHSVRGLRSSSENEKYDYTAFGESLESSEERSTSCAFTGQKLDSSTKLQYHRARWLNSNIGQWNSVDPFFDFEGNFSSAYSYSKNSPISWSDPTGLFSVLEATVSSFISELIIDFQSELLSRSIAQNEFIDTEAVNLNESMAIFILLFQLAPLIIGLGFFILSTIIGGIAKIFHGSIIRIKYFFKAISFLKENINLFRSLKIASGELNSLVGDSVRKAYFKRDGFKIGVGSAKNTHPEEVKAMLKHVESEGVALNHNYDVKKRKFDFPDFRKKTGPIFNVNEADSFGVYSHEYQHFLDWLNSGKPNIDKFTQEEWIEWVLRSEKNAYTKEIEVAREIFKETPEIAEEAVKSIKSNWAAEVLIRATPDDLKRFGLEEYRQSAEEILRKLEELKASVNQG